MATKKQNSRNTKRDKKEYSKVIVAWTFAIITFFFVFAFYEMHRLDNLEPLEFLTDIVKFLCVASVGGYFLKAKAENQAKIKLSYTKEINELKKKSGMGEDFIVEELGDISDWNS